MTDLRAEREVTEYSYNFVYQGRGADGRADDNVHALLSILMDLIEYREKLRQHEVRRW